MAGVPLFGPPTPPAFAPRVDGETILRRIDEIQRGQPYRLCVLAGSSLLNFMNAAWFALEGGHPISYLAPSDDCDPRDYDYLIAGPHYRVGWRPAALPLLESGNGFRLVHQAGGFRVFARVAN